MSVGVGDVYGPPFSFFVIGVKAGCAYCIFVIGSAYFEIGQALEPVISFPPQM